MRQVGIRQLKNSLSAYMRQVRRGESILVTDRGKTVAVLKRESSNPLKDRLEAAQSRGYIRIGEGGKPQGLAGKRKKVKGAPLSKTVIEDRR